MPGRNTITIHYKDEIIILSAARAAYWPAQKMLILADLHLGKTGYFRAHGIPVSTGVMEDDLKRLAGLIEQFKPEQVLVAGDMFHHQFNKDVLIFKNWRQSYKELAFVLVPGNHDRHMPVDYGDLAIRVTDPEHVVAPFHFVHAMDKLQNERLIISGHIHPGYQLSGKARQSLCLPCFVYDTCHLLLPAFSAFTGLCTTFEKRMGADYFVISDDKIFAFK
ncbi:ligase-associated DNA damage response endonuclease PdeM [Niabella sp. CC-SYL272]|uniref:ligase-associated DNA damage response endonuclease PdeM n=1 Tax=Niabella agricola TaxID=2891571 RepID=UPI001F47A1D7|nr:ligase-associated DNA damage response endonuclease PdeM [Niabella agricola]MCF3109012.1 ligase-associated DNA damage response endonuclease PdeM [Niabella agricola]